MSLFRRVMVPLLAFSYLYLGLTRVGSSKFELYRFYTLMGLPAPFLYCLGVTHAALGTILLILHIKNRLPELQTAIVEIGFLIVLLQLTAVYMYNPMAWYHTGPVERVRLLKLSLLWCAVHILFLVSTGRISFYCAAAYACGKDGVATIYNSIHSRLEQRKLDAAMSIQGKALKREIKKQQGRKPN
eukprot:PhM_4_TR11304/c0_g1_i1/m.46945